MLRFWDISVSLICKLHIWRIVYGDDISENVIYLCYYKTKSLQNVHVWCRGGNTHMIILKWFRCIIAKIYNILQYVIVRILRHMCNLHIKETEISQKRSKGIKNWKITYSVLLSVLSNKTNLILRFSSPLLYKMVAFEYVLFCLIKCLLARLAWLFVIDWTLEVYILNDLIKALNRTANVLKYIDLYWSCVRHNPNLSVCLHLLNRFLLSDN